MYIENSTIVTAVMTHRYEQTGQRKENMIPKYAPWRTGLTFIDEHKESQKG